MMKLCILVSRLLKKKSESHCDLNEMFDLEMTR